LLSSALSVIMIDSGRAKSMVVGDEDQAEYRENVGKHTVRFEPPDLIVIAYVGDVIESEVLALNEVSKRLGIGKRWLLSIVDMSRLGSVSPSARRAWMHSSPLIRGAVFVGVGSKLRMGLSVLVTAFNLMNRRDGVQVAFVDTEHEARAWVYQRRWALTAE
jgi:hypothetical protein